MQTKAKADKELIRSGAEYALVELIFSLNEANGIVDAAMGVSNGTVITV